jgi:DMSO/TMAO reductase YedYZ molybdopterin-dependent catalytic subunit
VEGISPLITPNDDFFRIDTAFRCHGSTPTPTSVRITGMVDRPYTCPTTELLEMADTEADVTLTCVSNEVGGDLIGNARWLGVPLDRLLDRPGSSPARPRWSAAPSTAGPPGSPSRSSTVPALVAVGMNGEPLPVGTASRSGW